MVGQGQVMTSEHVGIVELAEICARQRASALDLFEWLGVIAGVQPPALQRLVAEAAHRHAWHAELWAARSPDIPGVDLASATDRHRSPEAGPPAAERYRRALDRLDDDLAALSRRIDPDLDPASRRVIDLVTTDLADVRRRLAEF